jgi:hypothetical protein
VPNTYSFLNIHCVFSTKERVPILTSEIRERLWPYLGGIAKQNSIQPKCIGGVADHVHLLLSLPTTISISKRHPIDKGRIIHLDPPELPKIAQPFLARGLWGIQRRNCTNAGDDSLHRATAGTSSDPNIPRGISDDITEARDDIRREISLGLAPPSNRPYRTGRFKNVFQAINCLASAPWKRTSQQLKELHC